MASPPDDKSDRRGSTAVRTVFVREGLDADLEPGAVPVSVFDLITAEFDVRNSLARPADEIRLLAANRRRFRRTRRELRENVIELVPDTELFRVREHQGKPDCPWPGHGMRGHPDYPRGRVNVDGQAIIYCADSVETALAEVRAQPGTYFTVASLEPRNRLTLVRVAAEPGSDAGPFALINSWMSHPVNDRSRVLRPPPVANEQEHYYATQLFSCLVREERFDGIQFLSSVRKNGVNYAFFDPYLMDITDTRLIQV